MFSKKEITTTLTRHSIGKTQIYRQSVNTKINSTLKELAESSLKFKQHGQFFCTLSLKIRKIVRALEN